MALERIDKLAALEAHGEDYFFQSRARRQRFYDSRSYIAAELPIGTEAVNEDAHRMAAAGRLLTTPRVKKKLAGKGRPVDGLLSLQ